MSLIAELRVAGEPFAMAHALGAAGGMRAETEYSVPAPVGPVVFVWAWGGEFDAFEAALPDDPTVQGYDLIEDQDDRRLYEIVLDDGSALIDPAELHRATSASQLRMVTAANYAIITERLPDHDALTEYVRRCRDHGYEVELLRAYPGDADYRQYDVSEKQVAAIQAALEEGYFEVPRATDLESLAERFDISEQALSERLRRGVAAVLAASVGELADNHHSAAVDPGEPIARAPKHYRTD